MTVRFIEGAGGGNSSGGRGGATRGRTTGGNIFQRAGRAIRRRLGRRGRTA